MRVRAARPEDAAAVADIYNAGIRERSSTFETRERAAAEIAERIASQRHPFLVAELDGRVAGFAATAAYSDRDAYAGVAECSVYVDAALRGRGVGSALLAEMAERIAGERHPFLVAELDGSVAGFAATAPYSSRDAYAGVAECSVYVDAPLRGRGIGSALLAELATQSAARGFHKLLGKLFATNEASMRLVRSGGFRVVGAHVRHGQLDGEWRDVILVERSLQPPPDGLAGQPTMG